MEIGKTYLHEGSGATYVCLGVDTEGQVPVYVGEITDARGTRRHLISGAEATDWKAGMTYAEAQKMPDVIMTVSSAKFVPENAAPVPHSKSEAKRWAATGHQFEANEALGIEANKGEGKVHKKK